MSDTKNIEQALEAATAAVMVQSHRLDELTPATAAGDAVGLQNLMDVPVKVTVEVGRTRMALGELVKLGPGSLVVLDREAHENADVLVNGKIVARGEVVTIDGAYGVRITSLVQSR